MVTETADSKVALERLQAELTEAGCTECGSSGLAFSDEEFDGDQVEILIRCDDCGTQVFKKASISQYLAADVEEDVDDEEVEGEEEEAEEDLEFGLYKTVPRTIDDMFVLLGGLLEELGLAYLGSAPGHSSVYVSVDTDEGPLKKVLKVEHQSHNAKRSRDDIDRVGILVCWQHTWEDAPEHVRVIELSSLVREL
jgi:DNA-directed RNA polymerase subunit RPC12/RpoP